MKSVITKTIAALTITLAGALAQADTAPLWVCSLNFEGKSKSVQIIVGKSEFEGAGTIRCLSVSGERVELPITVTMQSKPIAARIGLGKMKLYGEALQISLFGTPESLLGTYLVAEARAAVVGGAGVIAAVHADNDGLAVNVSLQLIKGFGFDLGFRKMKIKLDQSRMNQPPSDANQDNDLNVPATL